MIVTSYFQTANEYDGLIQNPFDGSDRDIAGEQRERETDLAWQTFYADLDREADAVAAALAEESNADDWNGKAA